MSPSFLSLNQSIQSKRLNLHCARVLGRRRPVPPVPHHYTCSMPGGKGKLSQMVASPVTATSSTTIRRTFKVQIKKVKGKVVRSIKLNNVWSKLKLKSSNEPPDL